MSRRPAQLPVIARYAAFQLPELVLVGALLNLVCRTFGVTFT